jgi:hypothetical protein
MKCEKLWNTLLPTFDIKHNIHYQCCLIKYGVKTDDFCVKLKPVMNYEL